MKTAQIAIDCAPEQREAWNALAKRRGSSLAALVRGLLDLEAKHERGGSEHPLSEVLSAFRFASAQLREAFRAYRPEAGVHVPAIGHEGALGWDGAALNAINMSTGILSALAKYREESIAFVLSEGETIELDMQDSDPEKASEEACDLIELDAVACAARIGRTIRVISFDGAREFFRLDASGKRVKP